jgi:urea transport system permease protein
MNRFCVAGILLCCALISAAGTGFAATAAKDVSPELKEAIRSLKSSDEAVRQKAYDLIADKGDARLIPPLEAYRDGMLQDLDGHLIIYGKSMMVGDQKALPMLDAFTGVQLTNPDGTPQYLFRKSVDLSAPGMMRLPPAKRAERTVIADLVSTLSLLDPDPQVRIASIRDTGERAGKVFPDPDEMSRTSALLSDAEKALKSRLAKAKTPAETDALNRAVAALAAAEAEKPTDLISPTPSSGAVRKVISALGVVKAALPTAPATPDPDAAFREALDRWLNAANAYTAKLAIYAKNLDDLPKYAAALQRQLKNEPTGVFHGPLTEAVAEMDAALGDASKRQAAVESLGGIATQRAENILGKVVAAATRVGDTKLLASAEPALQRAHRYQSRVAFAQETFAGLSLGSIWVLLALGLAIVFGLMGVINMAHGEFMMVGSFATLIVSQLFHDHFPAWYDYYPIVAVPAAFIVAAFVGYIVELLVIRHLYGRPLDTMLATFGIGIIMIQAVRGRFGDNMSVRPPSWMEGGFEVMPDLFLAKNRLFIALFCLICIALVYLVVNRTKMGLLLRATTQNRQMAAALGVPTRRIDGFTFAFGCGLAGLAGVAVPLYNKINPSVGQEYIVDSFIVVVVGGVGTLAGCIWAGLGLGFINKYLESYLSSLPTFSSSSSVIAKVLVLVAVVVFLTRRPQGLFPPRGRMADA